MKEDDYSHSKLGEKSIIHGGLVSAEGFQLEATRFYSRRNSTKNLFNVSDLIGHTSFLVLQTEKQR